MENNFMHRNNLKIIINFLFVFSRLNFSCFSSQNIILQLSVNSTDQKERITLSKT